jgi:hypothetical protein
MDRLTKALKVNYFLFLKMSLISILPNNWFWIYL